MAATGYCLDFAEFSRLLRSADPAELNAAAFRLVELVFARDEEGPRVRRREGGAVSLQAAHAMIQQNAAAQRGLYNLAMSLWR